MSARFYAPVSLKTATVELVGSEAHHLQNVLRLKEGQQIVLFDGQGSEASAEIASITKKSVSLKIWETRSDSPEASRPIILATAVPKGERFRWLVEKATELGVSRLIPLTTEFSVVDPGSGKLGKMRQTVVAACKQSGRNRLMQIDEPVSWSVFLESRSVKESIFVAHPDGQPLLEQLKKINSVGEEPILLVVGPEGGFTAEEIEQAVSQGATLVSLGDNILRIETAAIALASLCLMNR